MRACGQSADRRYRPIIRFGWRRKSKNTKMLRAHARGCHHPRRVCSVTWQSRRPRAPLPRDSARVCQLRMPVARVPSCDPHPGMSGQGGDRRSSRCLRSPAATRTHVSSASYDVDVLRFLILQPRTTGFRSVVRGHAPIIRSGRIPSSRSGVRTRHRRRANRSWFRDPHTFAASPHDPVMRGFSEQGRTDIPSFRRQAHAALDPRGPGRSLARRRAQRHGARIDVRPARETGGRDRQQCVRNKDTAGCRRIGDRSPRPVVSCRTSCPKRIGSRMSNRAFRRPMARSGAVRSGIEPRDIVSGPESPHLRRSPCRRPRSGSGR